MTTFESNLLLGAIFAAGLAVGGAIAWVVWGRR